MSAEMSADGPRLNADAEQNSREKPSKRRVGEKPLPDVDSDGRTRRAQRFRKLVRDFAKDLGGNLSNSDEALVRNAAALVVRSEEIHARMLDGESVDDEQMVRLSHAASRILNTLRAYRAKKAPRRETMRERILREKAEADEAEGDED